MVRLNFSPIFFQYLKFSIFQDLAKQFVSEHIPFTYTEDDVSLHNRMIECPIKPLHDSVTSLSPHPMFSLLPGRDHFTRLHNKMLQRKTCIACLDVRQSTCSLFNATSNYSTEHKNRSLLPGLGKFSVMSSLCKQVPGLDLNPANLTLDQCFIHFYKQNFDLERAV